MTITAYEGMHSWYGRPLLKALLWKALIFLMLALVSFKAMAYDNISITGVVKSAAGTPLSRRFCSDKKYHHRHHHR